MTDVMTHRSSRAREPVVVQQARELLETVMDPCSVAAGRPVSIVAMGLVTDITTQGSNITLTLRTTFPGCTMAPKFAEAAEEQLCTLPGVETVEVVIDPTFTWSPDQARPEARALHLQPHHRPPEIIPWARRRA